MLLRHFATSGDGITFYGPPRGHTLTVFTGIVQALGRVVRQQCGALLVDKPPEFAPEGVSEGESIAINGCCLTATNEGSNRLRFDLSPETLGKTALGRLAEGEPVNLERAMSASSLFGGHIVQGHVDATGAVVAITPSGNSVIYRFRIPPEFRRYLIEKGSVAIDGISLTVVDLKEDEIDVWVIPHTLENTNLGIKRVGDEVNLEFDVIAKYVEKMLGSR